MATDRLIWYWERLLNTMFMYHISHLVDNPEYTMFIFPLNIVENLLYNLVYSIYTKMK